MDHYECLGVERNADAVSIQRAFRKKAMKAHPDRGGDAETFAMVRKAYETLINDDARAHYDRTGEDRNVPNVDAEAHKIVVEFFMNIAKQTKFKPHQYVKQIQADLDRNVNECKQKIAGIQREMDVLGVVGMPEPTNGEDNIFLMAIESQRDNLRHGMQNMTNGLATLTRAIELLAVYRDTYVPPPPQPVAPMQTFVFTNSATGSY